MSSRLAIFFLSLLVIVVVDVTRPSPVQAQDWCVPPDPDYCVTRVCQKGEGDCDPGQCAPGLTCVNDIGAQYGLPAHYDVCETGSSGGADPDYCVNNYCGIGDGDCDPGQCDVGTCVNDVGANYGLPAHYDVCEAGETSPPPATTSGAGQFAGTWRFTNSQIAQTYRFRVETCPNGQGQCAVDKTQNAILAAFKILHYSYVLLHVTTSRCHVYLLEEPQGSRVQGHYGSGPPTSVDGCVDAAVPDLELERYPTTGTRISQSAASPLFQETEEGISPDTQEAIKQAIEDTLFDLME